MALAALVYKLSGDWMFRQGRSLVGTLNIPVICSMLMTYVPTAFTFLSLSSQGWCLVSEGGRISLQISLSERGERPTHLDKLKPYVLENIVVLLVLPSPDAVCMSICSFILSIIFHRKYPFRTFRTYLLSAADTWSSWRDFWLKSS